MIWTDDSTVNWLTDLREQWLDYAHQCYAYISTYLCIYVQGGPKKSKPKTHDHNFAKS